MKSLKILFIVSSLLISASVLAQTKTEKIKVWGNCSSCKKHIEAATKVDGVTSANWSTKTKILTITYDPLKITNDQIQKNIAAVGYDTEKYKGDDKAYDELDPCCQYDRKDAGKKKE